MAGSGHNNNLGYGFSSSSAGGGLNSLRCSAPNSPFQLNNNHVAANINPFTPTNAFNGSSSSTANIITNLPVLINNSNNNNNTNNLSLPEINNLKE